MKLAQRVQKVKPSPTLAISAKAAHMKAQGLDVISLSAGEPDFDTPDYIKDEAKKAIDEGFTKYTAVDGIPELKQAIVDKFQRDNELYYKLDQILVSTGGKQSCYNLCQAYLNDGDEVIVPAPYWVSYPDMVLLAGAKPVIVPATSEQNYKITPQQLAQAVTNKTKMMFFNSPSNPSGKAYTHDELNELAEVLKKHPQILIATDDMYEHILWSQPFVNLLNVCPELYDRCIVLNGVSKAYSMTGWRIGYAAGPKDMIAAMKKIQSQSTSNPCSIAQKAAVAALNGGLESVKAMVDEFQKRHDFVYERLSKINGVKVLPSDGTFYIFPNIQDIIDNKGFKDDVDFCEQLLSQLGLATVPGSAFGNEGCIRLSFATHMDTLIDALDRFYQFCD